MKIIYTKKYFFFFRSSRHTVIDEVPRPTRFEIPDEGEESNITFDSTFDDITYESKLLVKPPPLKKSTTGLIANVNKSSNSPQTKRQMSFEELRQSSNTFPIKRVALQSEPQPKKPRVLDDQQVQAAQELLKEQSARKLVSESEDELEEDVDNDLETTEITNLEYLENDDDLISQENAPQKSCLKAQGTEVTPKKVRFSIDGEEKENSGQSSSPTSTNHAKIITEVLKKYPHLVKSNKNIKLKILQKGSPAAITSTTPLPKADESKQKVSYVVLKSDPLTKQSSPKSGGDTASPLGAENTTGPWICHNCGTPEKPLELESYYQYRRHLQDVHMEKFDSRICEHCGYKASKRNLLLYHLCIKHGIAPPRNCQFPKCDQCDYIALSESLLIKHRNNHANSKEFTCKVCRASFKSYGALQGHTQANLHSDQSKRLYECPHCQKPFVRNINLKAHIRTSHKDKRHEDDEEETLDLPVLDASNIEYILPDQINPSVTADSILSDHDYAEQGITTVTEIQYLEMDPSRPPPATQYITAPVNENAQFYSHDGQQYLVQNSGFEAHARLVELQQVPETLRIHEIRDNITGADVIHVVTEDQIRAMESGESVHLMVDPLDQSNIETISLNESELENMIVSGDHLQPIIIPNDQIQTIAINNDGIEALQLSEEQLRALTVAQDPLGQEDLDHIILNQHDLTIEDNQIRSISIHSEKEENKLISLDSIKQTIKCEDLDSSTHIPEHLDKMKILNISEENTIAIDIQKSNSGLKKCPMKKINTSLISKSLEESKKILAKDNISVHNINLNLENEISKNETSEEDIIPKNTSTSDDSSYTDIREKKVLITKPTVIKDHENKFMESKVPSFSKDGKTKLEPISDPLENICSIGNPIQMASLISNDWSDDDN